MATPDFGVPTLRALVSEGYDVVGVVCQPDKRVGRGMQVSAPPVKRAALAMGLRFTSGQACGSPRRCRPWRDCAPT